MRWILGCTLAGSTWAAWGPLGWMALGGGVLALAVRRERSWEATTLWGLHVGGVLAAFVAGFAGGYVGVFTVAIWASATELGLAAGLALGGATGGCVLALVHSIGLAGQGRHRRWALRGAIVGAVTFWPLFLTVIHGWLPWRSAALGAGAGLLYGVATATELTRGLATTPP